MKYIRYELRVGVNRGTEEAPLWEDERYEKRLDYNEANLAAAQAEAYQGQYTVEETEETVQPSAQDDTDAMLVELEYRVTLLELGLTET